MKLGDHQEAFAKDLVKLLLHIWDHGCTVRIGEVMRPIEMQALYVQQKKSKTMLSEHLNKCAADLAILRDGKVLDRDGYKQFGDFWESLDPVNRWGGNWRGLVDSGKSTFVDVPHFERRTS